MMQLSWSQTQRTYACRLWLCLCCASAAGCESFDAADAWLQPSGTNLASRSRDEERHRREYQTNGDPDGMSWLLANCIESGMSVADVNQVFGQEGAREFNDRWVKTHGGNYRSGDKVYKWGPDNKGRSAYLVFREGHLVNFDPGEFQ